MWGAKQIRSPSWILLLAVSGLDKCCSTKEMLIQNKVLLRVISKHFVLRLLYSIPGKNELPRNNRKLSTFYTHCNLIDQLNY